MCPISMCSANLHTQYLHNAFFLIFLYFEITLNHVEKLFKEILLEISFVEETKTAWGIKSFPKPFSKIPLISENMS